MYQNYFGEESYRASERRYLARTYLVMAGGLVLTFVTSLLTALFMPVHMQYSFSLSLILLLVQVLLAMSLGRAVARASYGTVVGMFILYSLVSGVSLSYIFVLYDIQRIFLCFIATATAFAAMAIIGFTTKRDLSPLAGVFFGGVIGLILLGIVGIFLRNAWFEVMISILGMVLFLGITAYDTQRLKEMYRAHGESALGRKLSVYAALQLYLDFINIFLYMIRIFGRSSRNR